MCGVSGELGVKDYVLEDEKLTLLRCSILRKGAAMGFKSSHDWHSTETFTGDRVASIHIYGPGFDLVNGERFSEGLGVTQYTRGTLHNINDYPDIIIVKE